MMTDQHPIERATVDTSPVARDYLGQLHQQATVRLGADEARELVADVTQHLRELGPAATEADVRNAVDRLGTPTELVDAAAGGASAPAATASGVRENGRLEAAALLCLVGSVVLFLIVPVSWALLVAGLVMLAMSHRWSQKDKILGFIAYGLMGSPSLLLAGFAAFTVTSVESCSAATDASGAVVGEQACSTTSSGLGPWVGWLYLAVVVAVLVTVTVRLARRARQA